MTKSLDMRVGFLGAGRMATALAKGLVGQGLLRPEQILASDPVELARTAFANAIGARTSPANRDVPEFASVIILAVKPTHVSDALSEISERVGVDHLLISIAAGVSIGRLESTLPPGTRVIRAMPNTPALIGAGAVAYALGRHATKADGALARQFFSAVGLAMEVKEPLLDAVTGLSGSGPAYGYLILEALSDGGVAAGLPRDVATQLAAQTLLGAARMVLETGEHPGALKDMVASPGGTTIEGLHELEKAGVRGALMNAVRAAAHRSKQLGQQ
jgi:pyrroline-5-carboxylate reductase